MCEAFENIVVLENPEHQHIPRATDASLASFETKMGFRLPNSFRSFALRFGGGELAGYFRIRIPFDCAPGNSQFELHSDIESIRDRGVTRFESYGVENWRKRLIVFASDIGGYWYCWDLLEVTNGDSHEYAIYELPRGGSMTLFASTFDRFVEK